MTIKIGKISLWHVHAWDYIREAQQHPDAEIAAVWDELPERGRAAAEQLGVAFFAALDDMLAYDGIEAVIVDAPTSMHHEVMIAAARAGKHIFTEKVLALTLKEANDIVDAAARNNVKLTVSLPRLNDGYTAAILSTLEQNLLGDVTLVRARLSHNGALAGWLPDHFYNVQQCGGGALVDLGCHPMYLTRLFLGQEPVAVTAHYGYVTGKEVEDNAVAVLTTDSGAIGVVEAGFVNSQSPFTLEIHGTKGTLLYGTPESKLLLRTDSGTSNAEHWLEPAIPCGKESAFSQWIGHMRNNTSADDNVRLAVDLTRLMEAANLSAQQKRTIQLSELIGG